ncbi:bifunctional diguanylate cyclase/phosphodiesterase [Thermocrinis sp.]|jgi:diguanylate cyclase (GGDEF)-like protein|uniref:bifunctional diguanylate cyclase/phosphodiesterase n=1 Tax=Thermocrinis sp. TaxID=2024383 RepID=UPI003BFD75C8
MGYKEKLLLALGPLSALFVLLIHHAVVPSPSTFSYLIAITSILTFFLFAGAVLAPLLAGRSLIKSKFYYTALFLVPSLIPQAFYILSFSSFPDFITPNHRDKDSWLYITFTAYTLLGITLGMLHKNGRFPYFKFFALLLSSLVISFFIVLYYPLLPKTYMEGVGSTTISDVLWAGLTLWGFLLAYFIVKKKAYGERVSEHIALGMFFYSVGTALPIFYTHSTDIILIAVSFYRALAYLLFAYGVVKVEIVDVGKEIVIHSRAFLSSLAKAVPTWEDGVLKVALGKVFEKSFIDSLCIYDLNTKELKAYFYGLKEREEDLKPPEDWSKILEDRMGIAKDGRRFHVREGYLLLSRSSADLENPLINIHTRNIESHLFLYFLQHKSFDELLKEKSREIQRLYTILETSEYTVQAYNNIDVFSKQVLDRLDYVLPMDGSFFYMFDQNAKRVERLILSSMFIKNFTEEEAKLLLAEVQADSNTFGTKDNFCFAKFEHDQYQAGVVGVRLKEPFGEDDLVFFKTVSNQLFHIVRLMKVIEDLESAQLSVKFLSEYDPLTMLYNRRTFERYVRDEVERSSRTGSMFSIVLIDIDDFKLINDVYGHQTADMVLKELSERLKKSLREMDILARFGGDEFAVLLPDLSRDTARVVAKRLQDKLSSTPVKIEDKEISLSVSAVVLSYPQDGTSEEELITYAEYLMREVKRKGKGIILSSEESPHKFSVVKEVERSVVESLEKSYVTPFYQEIIDLKDMSLFGFEVLMRIKFNGRFLSAEEFVDVAERIGATEKLGFLLIERVLENYKLFGNKFPLFIFINIVPENATEEFAEKVKALADKYSVPTNNVVFEITERKAIEDIMRVVSFVRELKNEGFRFAIDDFGSGYSSFYYLKYLPVDFLKIEGEFIKTLPNSPTDRVFIEGIVGVAKKMGIKTIAEFVENEEVLEVVKDLGIDYAQGYYFGKPESLEEKLKKHFSKV